MNNNEIIKKYINTKKIAKEIHKTSDNQSIQFEGNLMVKSNILIHHLLDELRMDLDLAIGDLIVKEDEK